MEKIIPIKTETYAKIEEKDSKIEKVLSEIDLLKDGIRFLKEEVQKSKIDVLMNIQKEKEITSTIQTIRAKHIGRDMEEGAIVGAKSGRILGGCIVGTSGGMVGAATGWTIGSLGCPLGALITGVAGGAIGAVIGPMKDRIFHHDKLKEGLFTGVVLGVSIGAVTGYTGGAPLERLLLGSQAALLEP